MSVSFFRIVVLCLVTMFFTSGALMAQEQRIGTNAASELLVPIGARNIAMGGASIATVSGVESIYWNPAGVSRSNYGADVIFSHMSHIADVGVNYAALGLKFGSLGTFGFSIKAMDIGEIPVTTAQAPDGTGALLDPQFVIVGLTYSRSLTDRISIGTTANIVSETLGRVSASTVAFDFGVQYRNLASIDGLNLAIAIKNLGPALQFSGAGLLNSAGVDNSDQGSLPLAVQAQKDELPSYIVIGGSYSMSLNETSSLELVGTFQDNNFQDDAVQFGAEYAFNNTFFVRGGYALSPDAGDDVNIYGFAAGAGIHYDFPSIAVTVDYAYREVDFFDASNIFSLKVGF